MNANAAEFTNVFLRSYEQPCAFGGSPGGMTHRGFALGPPFPRLTTLALPSARVPMVGGRIQHWQKDAEQFEDGERAVDESAESSGTKTDRYAMSHSMKTFQVHRPLGHLTHMPKHELLRNGFAAGCMLT